MGRAFGRTSLEASANGCAVIITNKGGLPETVTDAKILKNLNEKFNKINLILINNKIKKNITKRSIKNFYLTHNLFQKIDDYRSEKLFLNKIFI